MSKWEPIDTAPKDGIEILLFCPRKSSIKAYQVISYFGWNNWEDGHGNDLCPTHWQYLPDPPLKPMTSNSRGTLKGVTNYGI